MKIRLSILIILVAALGLFISVNLSAQIPQWEEQLQSDSANVELLFQLGRAYHDLGGQHEDKSAVKKADVYLSKLMALAPDNAVAMVYYGSMLTQKARDAQLPWKKMSYMKRGFAIMDSAVVMDPDEAEIRLIRAINGTSVPGMFQRLKTALADFKHIESLGQERLQTMTKAFWLPYYFYYGLALTKDEQDQEARAKLAKVIELDPQSELATKARQKLDKIK
ncbi:MAG: hypothetical protein ACOY90_19630 [Candidatus Zhuqueibacterota bacterium]